MKNKVMLDLETLGNTPNSVIVSIGAAKFNDDYIISSFYERVDAESCLSIGMHMDVSTVLWWMGQNEDARKELTQPGKKIHEVLEMFSFWIGSDAEVWGNGASFDNVLLSCAYNLAGLKRPWRYSDDRCYRTLKNLYPHIPIINTGTKHNALDDAKSQATHLISILKKC